jgi:hypothetical protein
MIFCAFVMTEALIGSFALSQTSEPEGHVTAIFHDVQLLPEQAGARSAAINDKVDDGTALRTGDDSRSELTFADLTITRLGANTIFSFNKAGRSIRLDSGSILLYARKNSGTAEISTKAVSAGITGTTVIFESRLESFDKLIVLEGAARFSLNKFPDQSTEVQAGQLLNVKAGAKKLPKPERVDLRRILETHPLIKNFPPLPSLDLILAVADGRAGSESGSPPVYVPNPSPTPGGGCADVSDKEIRCRPSGGYSYTFNVANNSGSAMSQVLLTPVVGSTFTLSPQLSNLSSALPNGQSTTITTNVGAAKAGDKVCFFVSLMSDKAPCCTIQVCPTMPQCESTPPPPPPPRPQLPRGRKRP